MEPKKTSISGMDRKSCSYGEVVPVGAVEDPKAVLVGDEQTTQAATSPTLVRKTLRS
jgi:hypothetical protein